MISGGSSAKLPPSTPGTTAAPPGTAGAAGTASTPAPAPVAIAVPVPVGTPAQAPVAAGRVVLTIASKGELFLDGRPISDDALPRTLRDLAGRSKDTQLVIRADKNVTAGRVVHVMDHAQQAGMTRIALTVSP